MMVSVQIISIFIVAVIVILPSPGQQYYRVDAFVPTCHQRPRSAITTSTFGRKRKTASSSSSSLWYADHPEDSLSEMKESVMRKEKSYGISTESMLFDAKKELLLEMALKDARSERMNGLKEKRFDAKKELLLEMALKDARSERLNGLEEKRKERAATATSMCSNISYLIFCYFILTNILVPATL
ncbi:hypothetical protein FRACYDRAFT_270010 [Fragilariopsis cylindrus CCMP1102]|uniref:UVR domain-containing protein n=1 Tax=Fragilariopsis cylindrus CCMP1102 TaxID=635003 RepID=A0A1E7F887_9STRA|nr:hypothetical protein FRACYDRAFT_270010 [Fragilariopsis cylindrus CCMP1102]|eukprot:OEU14053.1 hypothetical protein FRACYDRAFT_270010 [Fragilariopsis cylindrus CCMP1102]